RGRLLRLAGGADQLDAQATLRPLELLARRPVLRIVLHHHAVLGSGVAGGGERRPPLGERLDERLRRRDLVRRRQGLLRDLLRPGPSSSVSGAPLLAAAAARAQPGAPVVVAPTLRGRHHRAVEPADDAAVAVAAPTATRKDLQLGRRLVHLANGV